MTVRLQWLMGMVVACGACESSSAEVPASIVDLTFVKSEPTGPRGRSITVRARRDGKPAANLALDLQVARGGGQVSPPSVVTNAAGEAQAVWSLGVAPVPQRLQVSAPGAEPAVHDEPAAALAEPATAGAFAGIDAFLTAKGIEGSTEDLAFDPLADRLVLGVPGHLLSVTPAGEVSTLPLAGDALQVPLGLAYDAAGSLWVADSKGKALRRVDRDGKVTTVLTTAPTGDGTQPLKAPNDVAVGPDGRLYLTDVCLGQVLRVDPATAKVEATLAFDLATQGGPNGVTVSPDGQTLWLTTENTALFCPGAANAPIEATVAGLYRVPLTSTGFGERQTVHAALGLFGDGLGFDGEGNLYAIFDTQKDFALEESTVWVLTPGVDDTPRKLLAAKDRVFANLAFGRGAFGSKTLYLALLAVPVFTDPSMRGVERFEVGIEGP